MLPVKPRNYDILFEPDLKTFKFSGKEKIQVDIEKPTDKIVLNSLDIEILSCNVISNKKKIEVSTMADEEKQELIIKIPEKISGKAEIEIDFVGNLNDGLAGFYKSTYTEKGIKKYMATTQFEAADARRAFPCWDEPEAKATFTISMLVDPKLDAISNMPVASKKKISGKTLFKFKKTPVMSTYLVYLGVGEFEYLESNLGKIAVRIVTTKGKKSQGEVGMEMTKKFLDYYQKFFKISYPLPKLDIIAVPDFAAGAMENWGAITFRETDLLFDKDTSTTMTKHRIAEVVAHELAHQWFGNLVTMKWWNDLWLNESFATFMATKAVDSFYPEWDFWDQFISSSVNHGMGLDALKYSHPIDVNVKSPSQIREIFDGISYDKGGSVLRMLEDFIGEEDFRKGMKDYLTTHKYGNAVTDDLWDALGKASKKPVKEMMDTWVRQVGYPVIEAKTSNSKLTLTQKRFLLEGKTSGKELWMIPVSIKTKDRFDTILMKEKSQNIPIDNPNEWFKMNFGQKGFYRVKYERKVLEMLKELVRRKEMDNKDRWGIQSDLFSFCVGGHIGVKEYLDFINAYSEEDDYLVLDDIMGGLYFIYLMSFEEKFNDGIKSFSKEYFRKIFNRLGWDAIEGEKQTTAIMRHFAIAGLGKLGDDEILNEANKRFQNFLKDPSSLKPDLRSVVYSLVAWSGNEDTQNLFIDLYKRADTQEEKTRFLANIAGFQDKKLIQKALDYSLSPDVRMQDMYIPLIKAEGNPYGKDLIWTWLKKNWKEISGRLEGTGTPMLKRIVASIVVLSDSKKEKEIRDFFQKNKTQGISMVLEQSIEKMRIRSVFLEKMRKEFAS